MKLTDANVIRQCLDKYKGGEFGMKKAFREQLELDSMDFLDIVIELRKRHRIQIPEEDYAELASMESTVRYLTPRMKDLQRA